MFRDVVCFVLVCLMSVTALADGPPRLSREQFELIDDAIYDLDEILIKVESLQRKLRAKREEIRDLLERQTLLGPDKPAVADDKDAIPAGYMLVFTAPWCGPCTTIVKPSIAALGRSGWTNEDWTTTCTTKLRMVNIDDFKNKKLVELLGIKQEIEFLPTFVKMEGSPAVEVWRHTGPLDAKGIAEMYIGKGYRKIPKVATTKGGDKSYVSN